MYPVSLKTMLRCFLRSYLTSSAFNTRGMQNIGLAYAIDPGLQEIYPDHHNLQRARRRHVKLYNSHHLWNPILIALFLNLEKKISRGLFPPQAMPKVKSTLVFTLSAIGDSFFSGSLLVTWSLITILLIFLNLGAFALALGIALLVVVQIFKLITFHKGATQGLIFINQLKKWNLINWGSRLKQLNSFLIPAFWLVIWPFEWHIYNFILLAAAALILTYLYRIFVWSREILIMCILGLLFLAPQAFSWLEGKF